MTKWTDRLGRLIRVSTGDLSQKPNTRARDELPEPKTGTLSDQSDNEGLRYLERVREKLSRLVEDFAQGRVNQAQFEELYVHYQKERRTVEALLVAEPASGAWRRAVTEGQSINIRRRLAARVLGYAVFSNRDERSLRVYGEFTTLHERWISPLLDRVSETTNRLYVVGRFGTGNEGKPCLCAVSGEHTTLLVLFTTEPAKVQTQSLEDLHRHFEQANGRVLARDARLNRPNQPDDLVFPYAAAFE
jgi:hypothetical protein